VRVLIFHGYLLEGTGSNVYNARLAASLAELGHEVHLLSQERHPQRQPFIDAMADWDAGSLRVRELERPTRERLQSAPGEESAGRCTVYRPNIGGLLPVYVADRYEGIEARTFAQCSEQEVARYIDANVVAVQELVELVRPQLALANHLVMSPVILARALGGRVPYAVKIHGSALEYTVKPQPERFLSLAREGLDGAGGVLVGSRHTAESLWQTIGDPELPQRTRLGPPGVDVARFTPREPNTAAAGLRTLVARLQTAATEPPPGEAPAGGDLGGDRGAFARDAGAAAAALSRIDLSRDLLVSYVGKLIVSKGVDLLIAAWPLVLERVPHARLLVVGFGAYRCTLERLCIGLSDGDLEGVREIALAGRALEDERSRRQPLQYLLAFLDRLHDDGAQGGQRERYLLAARGLHERVVFSGRLEHDELAELLPACEAVVVPSTFPEAFGMVAAEAAACAALPISAAHSGLAEVSGALARAVPDRAAGWLSFALDEHAVDALASRVIGWLQADAGLRADTRAGLAAVVRERWSWEGVARGVIAAASGDLDGLARP
jgi:glycosyltransferase involved in cell wall biosynthesis